MMKIRVLGCAGGECPGHHPPALLLDGETLLDAGTIGAALDLEAQLCLRRIFLTHSHLDHVRAIPLLADNLLLSGSLQQVEVIAPRQTIDALRQNLFNNVISPDFSCIPNGTTGSIRFAEMAPALPMSFNGYQVTAIPVSHAVPAVALIVRHANSAFVYTGDTGPTDQLWPHVEGVDALIIEASFPNSHEELALLTGHLTPRLLAAELQKLRTMPRKIYVTHLKPQFRRKISEELMALQIPGLELLCEKMTYEIVDGSLYA